MGKYFFGFFFVLSAAIIANAVLLAKPDASSAYWLTVGWVVFLVLCNWFTSAALFSSKRKQFTDGTTGVDAVLPAISITVFVFSIASVLVVFLYHTGIVLLRAHLVLQISMIAVCLAIVMFQLAAAKGASAFGRSAHSKQDILLICRNLRLTVDADELNDVDRFIQFLEFKMPHPSKLRDKDLQVAVEYLKDSNLPTVQRIDMAYQALRSSMF